MPPEPDADSSKASLDELLADYLRRADAGEPVDQQALLAAHPRHAESLQEYFHHARAIEAAVGGATVRGAEETVSRTFAIRCPHCHIPAEVAVDAPLTNLTCQSCGNQFSLVGQANTASLAGRRTLGRFELIERLGVGAFGAVWKARDTELDRTVAIKIPRHGAMTTEDEERIVREARAAAQLRHPNIVTVHEVGRDGDSLYIVNDLIRGVTLDAWLTAHQPTSREAAKLCATIAGALHHAHEQGIVHRDLKPANIIMDGNGRPHLTDFGLARRETGEPTVTIDGQVLGTPAYMSPEQALGEAHRADRRSDVYSLGVILFQLLTGELPFRGSVPMLIHQVIHDDPPSVRSLNGTAPKDLETITLKCLDKDPGRRFPTALAVAKELERFLRGEPLAVKPPSRLGRLLRWYGRSAEAMVVTAGGFSVIVAMVMILWELCGLALIGLGQIADPGHAAIELALLALVFHPLLLYAGIATINRSMWGLALGALISCSWVVALVLAALNVDAGILQLDVLNDAVDTPFYRYQVIILFLIIAGLGAIVHLLALNATLGKRGR